MNIEYTNLTNNEVIVKLQGEMDALGCTHIRPTFEQIDNMEEQKHVTLDMSGVNFLDSSGVGVIVFLFKRLKAKGRTLTISAVQGQPLDLLELLRIQQVIPVNTEASTFSSISNISHA